MTVTAEARPNTSEKKTQPTNGTHDFHINNVQNDNMILFQKNDNMLLGRVSLTKSCEVKPPSPSTRTHTHTHKGTLIKSCELACETDCFAVRSEYYRE